MKKFILGAMAFIAVIMIVGSLWNMNRNEEHAFDAYIELFNFPSQGLRGDF